MSQEIPAATRDDALRTLRERLKVLVVSELQLPGRAPHDIGDEQPLFGEGGLGLDSLDALQIAMAIEEHLGVRVPEGAEARPVFRSVHSLAEFVAEARGVAGLPAL